MLDSAATMCRTHPRDSLYSSVFLAGAYEPHSEQLLVPRHLKNAEKACRYYIASHD